MQPSYQAIQNNNSAAGSWRLTSVSTVLMPLCSLLVHCDQCRAQTRRRSHGLGTKSLIHYGSLSQCFAAAFTRHSSLCWH